jgi:hypothetical protein
MNIDLSQYEELGLVVLNSQLKLNHFFIYHKSLGFAMFCSEDDLQVNLDQAKEKVEEYLWYADEEEKKKIEIINQNK